MKGLMLYAKYRPSRFISSTPMFETLSDIDCDGLSSISVRVMRPMPPRSRNIIIPVGAARPSLPPTAHLPSRVVGCLARIPGIHDCSTSDIPTSIRQIHKRHPRPFLNIIRMFSSRCRLNKNRGKLAGHGSQFSGLGLGCKVAGVCFPAVFPDRCYVPACPSRNCKGFVWQGP